MPIRILHLIGNLRLGGAQVCVKQLVEHNSDPDVIQYVYPLRCKKIDIPIKGNIIRHSYHLYDIRKFFFLVKICKQYNIDIIHAHLHKPILGALLATFFCKVKVLVHEHGPVARPGLQYSLYRLFLRLLKKRAHLFIAVSNAVSYQLTQYVGIDPACIRVVHNAVDLKLFTPSFKIRKAIRDDLNVRLNDIVIGFVGRLSYVKGPDITLDAFSLLYRKNPDTCLVFLGEGPIKSNLHAKAVTLGIDHRVKFLGFRKNVADIMNAFDIGCISSRQEAFGIAALEYMSMKIPLVSCNIYGLKEIVKHRKNTLIPHKNTPEEICKCIEELMQDETLRQSLTEKASAFVQQFDISHLIEDINRIYRKLKV